MQLHYSGLWPFLCSSRSYLLARVISRCVAKQHSIGFRPTFWTLTRYLIGEGYLANSVQLSSDLWSKNNPGVFCQTVGVIQNWSKLKQHISWSCVVCWHVCFWFIKIFQPADLETETNALQAAQSLIKTLYPPAMNPGEPEVLDGLIVDIVQECKTILRESEKKQAQHAIKVLSACISTTCQFSLSGL